jgi:hypothetical protein
MPGAEEPAWAIAPASEHIDLRELARDRLKFSFAKIIDAVPGDHVLIDYRVEMGYHSRIAALRRSHQARSFPELCDCVWAFSAEPAAR